MPARKSTSPEAAQRKAWKAELKQLDAAGQRVADDFVREQKRLYADLKKAEKAVAIFERTCAKRYAAARRKIDTRLAILRGRLGL